MASLSRFIQWRLRLRINTGKSAVAQPQDRHFLGFCLRVVQHGRRRTVEVGLSQRTKRNARARVRELTPRTWGGTLESCIARVNAWLRGWHRVLRDRLDQRAAGDAHDSTPISGGDCARSCCATGNVNERSLGA